MFLSSHLRAHLSPLCYAEEGQGLVEYGLILVLVSIVSITALIALGISINGLFTTITGAV